MLLPSYRVSKQFLRFILVFLLTLEAIRKIFSLPLGQAKMSQNDITVLKENLEKQRVVKKG